MILLIDHADSFVHNLARYFRLLGAETKVVAHDHVNLKFVRKMWPKFIVLSPGPCSPHQAPESLKIVKDFSGQIPILGVCLGHQIIGAAFGGKIIRAKIPMHGRASVIEHSADGLFKDLPPSLKAGRYHSLVVDHQDWPKDLTITGHSPEGEVMALQHKHHPTYGVQFHPESILTDYGIQLLKNFLSAKVSP